MPNVTITASAEIDADNIKQALRVESARKSFRDEVASRIEDLKAGMKPGRPLPEMGPAVRQVTMRKGSVLMRYEETPNGSVEIFEFLFARMNH